MPKLIRLTVEYAGVREDLKVDQDERGIHYVLTQSNQGANFTWQGTCPSKPFELLDRMIEGLVNKMANYIHLSTGGTHLDNQTITIIEEED